jgi:hypothetical protein
MTTPVTQPVPIDDLTLDPETLNDLAADTDVRGGARSQCTYEQSGCM